MKIYSFACSLSITLASNYSYSIRHRIKKRLKTGRNLRIRDQLKR